MTDASLGERKVVITFWEYEATYIRRRLVLFARHTVGRAGQPPRYRYRQSPCLNGSWLVVCNSVRLLNT